MVLKIVVFTDRVATVKIKKTTKISMGEENDDVIVKDCTNSPRGVNRINRVIDSQNHQC